MASKEITSDLESIEEILINTKERYFIPEFQRNFVWGRDEVKQLFYDFFEDADGFFKETSTLNGYLLGNIVLINNEESNYQIVIDGQQRLTTITLIARALYKEVTERIKKNPVNAIELMKYTGELDKAYASKLDDGTFTSLKIIHDEGLEFGKIYKKIVTQSDENDVDFSSEIETEADKNIYIVYGEAVEQLKTFDITQLRRFLIYFKTKVKLIVTRTPNVSKAFQLFEILNGRGKALEPMDLIKNIFLKKIYDSKNNILQEEFTENWKKMIKNLHDEKKILSTSTFLKYFIVSYWGKNEKNDNLYDFLRNKCNKDELSAQKVCDIVKIMAKKSNIYADIEKENYESFVKDNNMYILFKLLKIKQFHPILMMFYDSNDEQKIEILNHLVRLGAAVVFAFVQTNSIEKILAVLASNYIETAKLDKDKAYVNLLYMLNQKIELYANEVRTSLAAKNLAGVNGNANTKAATILKFIELFFNENSDVINKSKITVEHILSKQISLDDYNISYNDIGFQNKGDFDNNKHRIGNLTLLYRDQNSSLKNKSFIEKKDMYANSNFRITSTIIKPLHTEIKNGAETKLFEKINSNEKQYASNNTHWNVNLIDERGRNIANLLYSILTQKTNAENKVSQIKYDKNQCKLELIAENTDIGYVLRKEVLKKLLTAGFTLPSAQDTYFIRIFANKIKPGDSIKIYLCFKGKKYSARIYYVDYSEKNKRKNPTLQIIYSNKDGFLDALQNEFHELYEYFQNGNQKPPVTMKEYLDLYITDDLYTFNLVHSKN